MTEPHDNRAPSKTPCYDGICPKNAVCTACDYHFGGLPIEGGVIICPECGHAQTFELPEIDPPRPRYVATQAMYVTLICLGIGIAATVAGLPAQTAAVVALSLISATLPIVMWRAWKTWRRAKRRWVEHCNRNRDAT